VLRRPVEMAANSGHLPLLKTYLTPPYLLDISKLGIALPWG